MQHEYLLDGPAIGTGALDLDLTPQYAGGGISDFVGDRLGFEILAEEAETSIGGPDTST